MDIGYSKAMSATIAEAETMLSADNLAEVGIAFHGWCDFMTKEPSEFDWIITNVIAKGMKGDLNAKSKQCKSFFGLQLAMCISTGRQFLNMQVPKARRCAYFNLELMERGVWERSRTMSRALFVTPPNDMLYFVNLRGKAKRLREDTPALVADVRRRGIDLVILDPRYKLIGEGEDENNAAGLRGVLDFRDKLAEVAAVLMIGHDPKGNTAGKSMADRGAGSYTAGADYDFSFALSPHVDDGYSVLSTSCRYRKSPPDLSIKFDPNGQIFVADVNKRPIVASLKIERQAGNAIARRAEAVAKQTAMCRDLLEIVKGTKNPMCMAEVEQAMHRNGHAIGAVKRQIKAATAKGLLVNQSELEGGSKTGRKQHGATYLMTPEAAQEYRAQYERQLL